MEKKIFTEEFFNCTKYLSQHFRWSSRRPAPKSVLKARGEYVTDESSVDTDDEDDVANIKVLPKGYKYR